MCTARIASLSYSGAKRSDVKRFSKAYCIRVHRDASELFLGGEALMIDSGIKIEC